MGRTRNTSTHSCIDNCEYSLFAAVMAVRLVLEHVPHLLTALWKNRIITRNRGFSDKRAVLTHECFFSSLHFSTRSLLLRDVSLYLYGAGAALCDEVKSPLCHDSSIAFSSCARRLS
jgi:hypothetical protein